VQEPIVLKTFTTVAKLLFLLNAAIDLILEADSAPMYEMFY